MPILEDVVVVMTTPDAMKASERVGERSGELLVDSSLNANGTDDGQPIGSTVIVTSSTRCAGPDDDDDVDSELDEDAPTEQRLMDWLMRHYEKSVRPVRNASDTVLVRMGLTLTQIFNMVQMSRVNQYTPRLQ